MKKKVILYEILEKENYSENKEVLNNLLKRFEIENKKKNKR
jgi:hypothetical protein